MPCGIVSLGFQLLEACGEFKVSVLTSMKSLIMMKSYLGGAMMGSITIRNLPDQSKESLRVQAAKCGISLEAYVRNILEEVSGHESDKKINILELAQGYFGPQGGEDLELPKRGTHRDSSHFST